VVAKSLLDCKWFAAINNQLKLMPVGITLKKYTKIDSAHVYANAATFMPGNYGNPYPSFTQTVALPIFVTSDQFCQAVHPILPSSPTNFEIGIFLSLCPILCNVMSVHQMLTKIRWMAWQSWSDSKNQSNFGCFG